MIARATKSSTEGVSIVQRQTCCGGAVVQAVWPFLEVSSHRGLPGSSPLALRHWWLKEAYATQFRQARLSAPNRCGAAGIVVLLPISSLLYQPWMFINSGHYVQS